MRLESFAALCAVATQGALAWDHASAAKVRESLEQKETTLVAFLAPSTEASKKLEPEWDAVVAPVFGAKLSVDCLSESALCASLDVVSFPTIRLYRRDGSMIRYKGPRKSDEIKRFLRRTGRPPVTDLDSTNTKQFIPSDNVVIVAKVPPSDATDEIRLEDRFRAIAAQYSDRYSFGLSRGKADETAVVHCYNNLDGAYSRTNELEQFGALEAFVKKCSLPFIPELTRRNEADYLQPGKSLVYFFSPDEVDRKNWVGAIRPLARRYAEYLTFVTVDSSEYPEIVTGLGVPGGAAATGLSLSNPGMGKVFPFPDTGELNLEAVEQFIVGISEGKIDAWDGQWRESTEGGEAKGHDEL